MTEIFISHAVKDKKLAGIIEKLISESYDIDPKNIFCSSIDGALDGGSNFVDAIKSSFEKSKLIVLLLSKNYFESRFCLSELGATWIAKNNFLPVIVPPEDFDCCNGVLTGVQAVKIDELNFSTELSKKLGLLKGFNSNHEKILKLNYLNSRDEITRALNVAEKERNGIEYDVFISAPMSYESDSDFQKMKSTVKVAINTLKNCKSDFTYHYAGDNFETLSDFQTTRDSAEDDLTNLNKSRTFLMILPEQRMTSCFVEAGYAIAKGKRTVFMVKNKNDLPFILAGAESADGIGTRVYEYDNEKDLIRKLELNINRLV